MSYHDLTVDGRNASIFGFWLLRRGDARHLSRPWKGCSSCACLLPGLTWCWSAQLGLSVPSGSSQFNPRARVQLALPETLQVFPKICSSRGWESDRLYYRESVCPFLRISYISGSNKTIKSKTTHKELDNWNNPVLQDLLARATALSKASTLSNNPFHTFAWLQGKGKDKEIPFSRSLQFFSTAAGFCMGFLGHLLEITHDELSVTSL